MKFRILKNKKGRFQPQVKGWFLWNSYFEWGYGSCGRLMDYYTVEDAEEFIKREYEDLFKKKMKKNKTEEVVKEFDYPNK